LSTFRIVRGFEFAAEPSLLMQGEGHVLPGGGAEIHIVVIAVQFARVISGLSSLLAQ
jgi:hypothetical protein